ncbi:MAG: hypothetical protein V1836_01400 [Candidatus Aenigmatarchaeota archaeon]
MKGFIRIIEIILCVLLILFALMQFSSLYSKETPWPKNYLSLLSRDMAYTVNFLGNDWQNSTFVRSSMGRILFSDFIEYEFGLKNTVNRNVIAGCFCSSQELSQLRQQLTSFTLNNRNVNFNVLDMADVNDWNSLDVIVYGHYQAMDSQKANILNFLANDKGIMLIGSLSADQISSDSVLRDVFGLKWMINPVSGSSSDALFIPTHPSNESYEIMKYFYGFRASHSSMILNSETGLGQISCTNSTSEGILKTRGTDKKFWIMDASSKRVSGTYCDYVLYVDENGNGQIDVNEGPYGVNDNVVLNGFSMTIKSINVGAYNEKAEAESGTGWGLASASGFCTGDGDDVCSDGDAAYTTTQNTQINIPIAVNRPDRYEVWLRSYISDAPQSKERVYFVSIDGGSETLVDPFYQSDPNFAGSWGWNRTGMAGGFTILLDAGTHNIRLRTPTNAENNKWQSSGVDWIFLRNTTFSPKNSVELLFNNPYRLVDFSQTGPYPDNDKVDRIAVANGRKYMNGGTEIGPVAALITKKGITEKSSGRAIWLASNADGKDFENLVKSSVIWLTPKEFINERNPSLGSSASQAYAILENGDMSNLYQIFVTLWYSRRSD